jgi:hypothetical protein
MKGWTNRTGVAVTAAVAALAIVVPAAASGKAPSVGPATRFSAPVRVTPPMGFGYEPTAHKENWQLAVAPDTNSPTQTRSMSWAWVSVDGGQTWVDPPGLTPLSLEQHEFGDEGDMALDDAGHLYYVDTEVVDDTITRWSVNGHGVDHMTLDFTRPLIPTLQPEDDRPWIIAHGDGHVFYFGNEGNKTHFGGRYLVYQSYDGGQTFNPMGTVLEDSGWCRPAADHTRGSKWLYVICTNDEGALYAYVSSDDGHTFKRSTIGHYNHKMSIDWQSWPTPVVASDGTVYSLFVDARTVTGDGTPVVGNLELLTSRDHGRRWTYQDITPRALRGQLEYGWLAVSPTSPRRLGLAVYYRPNTLAPWRVYGGIWTAGQVPQLSSIFPNQPAAPASEATAPGDYLNSTFDPQGRLNVVWTHFAKRYAPYVALREIFFSRSL